MEHVKIWQGKVYTKYIYGYGNIYIYGYLHIYTYIYGYVSVWIYMENIHQIYSSCMKVTE